MEEEGVVIGLPGPGRARVKMVRSAMCAGCGARNVCQPMSQQNEMVIEVDDPLGVKVGQKVSISLQAATVLKASFAVYILPLLALIVCGAATQKILAGFMAPRGVQFLSALAGFTALGLTYLFLRLFFRRSTKATFRPSITTMRP